MEFFARLAFVLALIVMLSPVVLAGDTAFGDIEKNFESKSDQGNKACCDRGIYSKSFDRWIDDYLNNKDTLAEKDWAGVLKAATGATHLDLLASSVFTRLEFLEGEKEAQLERRGGCMAAMKAIFVSTTKILGVTNQTATLSDYLSNQYANSSDFANGIFYAKKSLATRELLWGKEDFRLVSGLVALANVEIQGKDYGSARQHAERGLAIATRTHFSRGQYESRLVLTKLGHFPH